MPNTQELRLPLSEQVKHGLPQHAFSEQALWDFLNTATFDGGRIHRYVEGRSATGAGQVADLQVSIERFPTTLFACLHGTARMERREKRALASYLRATLSLRVPEPMLRDLLETLESLPETPTFQDVPRFRLPGW